MQPIIREEYKMKKLISTSNLLFTKMFVFFMYALPGAANAQVSFGGGGSAGVSVGFGSGGGVGGTTGGTGGGQIGEILCNIVGWFTGPVGQGLATLAVIVIGVGALMGKVSWGMAIIVAVGIAAVFGAPTIVGTLGGNTAGC